MKKYVVYTRCSTAEQRKSNLGLLAQRRDVDLFLTSYSEPWKIVGEFTDQGSGADNGRPEFQKALAMVRETGAELLVSKVDRLSRKVSLIATLMDDRKVRLRVASMPHADKFQLHIYAALAEQERDFISKRTRAALAEARRRGKKLGGYRPGSLDRRIEVLKQIADADTRRVIDFIQPLRQAGRTLREIAEALEKAHLRAPRGDRWTASQVMRTLKRAAAMEGKRSADPETIEEEELDEGLILNALRRQNAVGPQQ